VKIKSSFSSAPPVREYPYVGACDRLNPDDVIVVLFHKPNAGMVIHAGPESVWNVGNYLEGWEEKLFETFEGAVTLAS
jgi:hypothetical protein